jgi:methyl-accepting chemotaxis protein
MVGGHIAVKKKAMACIGEFGRGNFEAPMEKLPGKKAFINDTIEQVRANLKALIVDANILVQAAADGKLDTRADATKHQGDFRKIVQGVNDTITNIVNPLMVTADYVDKVSKGIIPPTIVTEYKGQYNVIKTNLNNMVTMMNDLLSETDKIVIAAADGQLDKRADAAKFVGGWNKLVSGVNDTITNIVNPLMVTATYVDKISKGNIPAPITDEYKGQYNIIKTNLNQCIIAVNALVADALLLAKAAVEGRLDTRADASKHQGDFAKIVKGVNDTLDAVLDPIKEASNVLESLSKYDLRARVKGNYQGDHAKIKNSLNETGEALHNALIQVAEAVDQISSASGQIASSSQQVAEGASEQASSLEETSSSLEEMSSMTKQNAENTQQTKALTDATKSVADRGASSMSSMVDAMGKIRNSAENTAEIIKDINEIAFQTNLLALNAAVEAARAGDAGRGFAVVAEEVRNLAGRAKEAAKKTEELIKQSVQLSESGAEISKGVSVDLNEIVTSVGKVADIVSEITVASREQTRGIDQVNKAVAEMDKVVQQAAANSEESSSAAEELAGQAQELAAMVSKFQLNRTSTHRTAQKAAHKIASNKPSAKTKQGNGHATPGWSIDADAIIPMGDDPDFASF